MKFVNESSFSPAVFGGILKGDLYFLVLKTLYHRKKITFKQFYLNLVNKLIFFFIINFNINFYVFFLISGRQCYWTCGHLKIWPIGGQTLRPSYALCKNVKQRTTTTRNIHFKWITSSNYSHFIIHIILISNIYFKFLIVN